MELRLGDGRTVQVWDGGSRVAGAPVVVFFHGCPDTRWAAMTGHQAAVRAGVRLVCANRPGYGASTAAATTHTSVADDALAVADLLGAGELAVLGMSVGGPYALATAARAPGRVRAAAVVAAPGDLPEQRQPGSAEEVVERSRPEYAAWCAQVLADDADSPDDAALAGRFLAGLPGPDAALLAAYGDAWVAASLREALAQPEGFLRDAAVTFGVWDFAVEDVTCPTSLWCGAADTNAPPENGDALAARLPDAHLHLGATTHLATLLTRWDEVLEHLR
ncbi:alpha/beta fold hydrolase [Nocardioides taihuensis]|uniref:Alpha/beta fold hydrolase n=1 Tax=Nocardioides taihuensis TaxID=1835606 RepID=A0ABW0BF50_9ACTN